METESTCSVPYGWAWERQIQLIPSIPSSLMREYGHTLDDESFRTLLTKVECILNSQPLSTPSGDPRNSDPLTPSHVLTLKSRVVILQGCSFVFSDIHFIDILLTFFSQNFFFRHLYKFFTITFIHSGLMFNCDVPFSL